MVLLNDRGVGALGTTEIGEPTGSVLLADADKN